MIEIALLTIFLASGTIFGLACHSWSRAKARLELRSEKQYVLTEAIQILALTHQKRGKAARPFCHPADSVHGEQT
jgi:hypothetical protein